MLNKSIKDSTIRFILVCLIGLLISVIILFPQENEKALFMMAIYYFPLYFFANILIAYIIYVNRGAVFNHAFFKIFRISVYFALVVLFIISLNHYFHEILLFSFLVHFFALSLSILIYNQHKVGY
jgi:hypothetical protein